MLRPWDGANLSLDLLGGPDNSRKICSAVRKLPSAVNTSLYDSIDLSTQLRALLPLSTLVAQYLHDGKQ